MRRNVCAMRSGEHSARRAKKVDYAQRENIKSGCARERESLAIEIDAVSVVVV